MRSFRRRPLRSRYSRSSEDITDSLSVGEVGTLLAGKVDESTYQSGLSLQRDKEGSLSRVQTANLYQTKVDSTAALH